MSFRPVGKTERDKILMLLICILAGSFLRIYTFDQKSLWIDEIHTFHDSRDGLTEQILYYKQDPTGLHPPLFYLLTHLFYPFTKLERDLRMIPLIFGILCIPMIYLLTRTFKKEIALACTVSLVFMTYHISLSQDGRSYPMDMFLGMAGLYFLRKYAETSKKRYIVWIALSFSISFYTSYSSILFVVFSQILWLYRGGEHEKRPGVTGPILLNGLMVTLCAPWVLFLASNYKGQPLMDLSYSAPFGSPLSIGYGLLHDWAAYPLLMVVSGILLVVFPFLSRSKRNAWVLLGSLMLPILGAYLFCKVLNITHFLSSRYFVGFLPLFLITLYLSLYEIEATAGRLKGLQWAGILFTILFVASNGVMLHSYYRSEKQDFRGLVNYLKVHLRQGDRLFDADMAYMPGILHYFGDYPEGRRYRISYKRISERENEFWKAFQYQNNTFTIYHSPNCCARYVADRNRLWIVAGKESMARFAKEPGFVLKGTFDGSFLNFNRFPSDASLWLFLWDPSSQNQKGMDLPIP
jgi:hypothetical protein